MTFWPDNEPRIHAMVDAISKPFDFASKVEIKLSINNRTDLHGEITFIVPVAQARNYRIGSVYAAHFKLMSEMQK